MSQPTTDVIEYQMGYTEPEFERTLKGRFTGESSAYNCTDIGELQWQITQSDEPSFDVVINIQQGPDRKIAMLTLPVLHVTFTAKNTAKPLLDAFLDRFFKYFQKGGG